MKLIAVLLMALALIACEQNEPTEESAISGDSPSVGEPDADPLAQGEPDADPAKDLYIVVLHTIKGEPAFPNTDLVADAYNTEVVPSNLETLAQNGYKLIQIIEHRGEFYYYFQK